MRILHFFKTALPDSIGGVEQMIDQLARGTSRLGANVSVLSLSRNNVGQSFQVNGYQSYRARLDFEFASTGFSLPAFKMFSSLAKEADVIHYHFPWPFMDLVHFTSRVRKPTLVTYHSDIVRQHHLLKLYRPLQKRFLADVDRIVATSPNYLASSGTLERFRSKVKVIPIGLDRASYPVPTEERLRYWRTRFGPRFFVFVGVLRYYKGLHILIDALRGTSFPVVIIGSGPIEQDLKIKASQLGINNVHFLGSLPEEDKVALQELSYAVLFPSHLRSEAFGISLLEGAMYGKPMISSEIGTGTTFVNVDGETGLVVPPGDPEALRSAMQILWNNTDKAADMGRQAEQRYSRLFTAEQMSCQYMEIYQQLLSLATHTYSISRPNFKEV